MFCLCTFRVHIYQYVRAYTLLYPVYTRMSMHIPTHMSIHTYLHVYMHVCTHVNAIRVRALRDFEAVVLRIEGGEPSNPWRQNRITLVGNDQSVSIDISINLYKCL